MPKYIIGIDVGGTNTKFGLVNPKDKVIARTRLDTKSLNRSKNAFTSGLADTANSLIAKNGLRKSDILGVGMGWPGFINPQKGVVQFLPNIPGWKNVPAAKILREKLKLPVFIENDVNLITLAEWKQGAGKGYADFICLTLGTGVGSGLILNGALYHGCNFAAGEIGHIPFQSKTLEKYIGNKALHKKAARIFNRTSMRTQDVHALAKKNNAKAREYWVGVGRDLGFVLAGVVNTLNPQLIIIGGGVSNNYPFFSPSLKKTIKEKSVSVSGRVKIVRAKLGDNAGIIGASYLVKESLKKTKTK